MQALQLMRAGVEMPRPTPAPLLDMSAGLPGEQASEAWASLCFYAILLLLLLLL
jgi:hypothetical protein